MYNWALNIKAEAFKAKEKIPNYIPLGRQLTQLKKIEFPWMYEVSKCACYETLKNVDAAFSHFFRKCKLKRAGKHKGKCGFPKFKSRKTGIGGFRLTGTIKIYDDHIKLPRIGIVKLKERNYLPVDKKIFAVTISEKARKVVY